MGHPLSAKKKMSMPLPFSLASTFPMLSSMALVMEAQHAMPSAGDVREAIEVFRRRRQRRVDGVERQVEEKRLGPMAVDEGHRLAPEGDGEVIVLASRISFPVTSVARSIPEFGPA